MSGITLTSDERLRKTADEGRRSRASDDRAVTENRELSDDDRVALFRTSLQQEVLPNLPQIPGYHVCWLSTTNQQDTIVNRMRLGYTLLTQEDIPGVSYPTMKTGDYAGCIAVNEMLAAKLPMRLYERFMQAAHFDGPNAEEEKLRGTAQALAEQARRQGASIAEYEGNAELGRASRRPSFTQ